MYKDLHKGAFDRATCTKLELFEEYAKAWIPTFVMEGFETIYIFDFFAGSGRDKIGITGSPIRILNQVKSQFSNIKEKGTTVCIVFNEYIEEKSKLLKGLLEDFINLEENRMLKELISRKKVQIRFHNEKIEDVFSKYYSTMQSFPSLVYMDQNGVKFLTLDYLAKFEACSFMDVLYFISSSHYQRFCREPEFKNLNLPINTETIKKAARSRVHEVLVEEIRRVLPRSTSMRLYPFSLKKDNGNVHGVIFGAKHPRAVDKFLHAAWKLNSQNGCANYDIEEESKNVQLEWDFQATGVCVKKSMTKIEKFKKSLREAVLSGKIKSNADAYFFVLSKGHIPAHAKEELMKMKEEKLIYFEGRSPSVTYIALFGKKENLKKVDFKLL